jgi:predicted aspartyl protease
VDRLVLRHSRAERAEPRSSRSVGSERLRLVGLAALPIGMATVENVTAAIAPVQGSLLLGQSFLNRFSSWSIDNTKHVLILK